MKTFDTLRIQPAEIAEAEIARCTNVENRYVCSICVEICLTVEQLKFHFINIHGCRTTSYESSDSSQSEKEKVAKKKETPVVKVPVVKAPKLCEICDQLFKTAKILSRHIKHVHNKIKQFHCSVCSKQFSRKAALQVS
jgi:NAD-dependent SIR2 family protein deacetylase